MSRRHKPSIPAKKHTTAEKIHLARLKRKSGPSGKRRAERRAHLQRKPVTSEV